MNSIFDKIDNFNFSFLGFNPLGSLQNISMWRKYVFILFIVSISCWAVFGWESTWNQPAAYVQAIPALIAGETSLNTVQAEVDGFYGVGQHLSSAVIYGACFLLLSIHLEKNNIKKSMNFMLSTALSLFSVGVYEIIYNILYSNLQAQPWTFSLAWKQGLNIVAFFGFTVLGVLCLIYLYSMGYKPNFNKITKVLLIGSILTYALWVFYPLPITALTMETSTGTWVSGDLFPQTMYAVDVDPTDSVAIGEPVYVQNDFLHFVNILNKAIVSLTILSFVMVRRKSNV